MNQEQLSKIIELLEKQNQLLEGIDWKLWEIYKVTTGNNKDH